MPRFQCVLLAQPHARVLKLQKKRGIIVHSTNIQQQKIDKKRVINKEPSQNFVGFVQWIPTKHILTLRTVRILIFVIVFWRWKCPFSRFFKFQSLINWKISILEKNHKSIYLLFRMAQKPIKICLKWKKWKICNLFEQFFLNNGGIIFLRHIIY